MISLLQLHFTCQKKKVMGFHLMKNNQNIPIWVKNYRKLAKDKPPARPKGKSWIFYIIRLKAQA